MDVTATGSMSPYAVRCEKLAQDAVRAEGEAAVELIDAASPPPVGAEGQGSHVNTYA
jgi:hypothetical protein